MTSLSDINMTIRYFLIMIIHESITQASSDQREEKFKAEPFTK